MSNDERIALETVILETVGPVRGLEWGSGASTVHFGKKLPPASSWLSIEHQPEWYDKVSAILDQFELGHVRLHLVEPDGPHVEGSGDGDERTFHNYVHFPECMEGPFNFVFVDGRARNACARIAWKMLSDDGVLAVHDAQRQEYDAVRPADAWRIRLHDPRRQVDGGNVELHLFMRNSANE